MPKRPAAVRRSSRTGSTSASGSRRNLSASIHDQEYEETKYDFYPVIGVVKKIDPLIWRISKAYDAMNDYSAADQSIKDALDATNTPFVNDNLDEAQELHSKGVKALYTSYRWLKTSSSVLYKLLKRV